MELSKYEALKQYGSWKSCSCDTTTGISMINNDQCVINYDHVKRYYMNSLKKSEENAASVDTLVQDENGHLYMIEFKNGEIDNKEIRNKVIESLLIFCDITKNTIEFTRQNMDFILIYNPDLIHIKPLEQRALFLARLGKSFCPFHGLDKFYGFCVQKAYMMTAKEFTDNMLHMMSV